MAGPNVQAHSLQAGLASHQEPPPRSGPRSPEENSAQLKRERAPLHHQEHLQPSGIGYMLSHPTRRVFLSQKIPQSNDLYIHVGHTWGVQNQLWELFYHHWGGTPGHEAPQISPMGPKFWSQNFSFTTLS